MSISTAPTIRSASSTPATTAPCRRGRTGSRCRSAPAKSSPPATERAVMISAIVFDFDGVLADSEVLHLRAYQEVLAPRGLQVSREDYFARYLGFDDNGVLRTVAADRGVELDDASIEELIARKSKVFERLEANAEMLFPGAAACVR